MGQIETDKLRAIELIQSYINSYTRFSLSIDNDIIEKIYDDRIDLLKLAIEALKWSNT